MAEAEESIWKNFNVEVWEIADLWPAVSRHRQSQKMTGSEEENSLEYHKIRSSELYPRKPLVNCTSLPVPYPELTGEGTEYQDKTSDGVICLSNYRLFVRYKDSFANQTLGSIESVDYRDLFHIYICCKDGHSFKVTFDTNETCLAWFSRLCEAVTPPAKLNNVFAFAFFAHCRDAEEGVGIEAPGQHPLTELMVQAQQTGRYSFGKEVARLGYDLRHVWRITQINEDYKLCHSYPQQHIVPKDVSDDDLKTSANFRAGRRFPSVVWRHRNGAVMVRCSQPEVGLWGWRCTPDENIMRAIPRACAANTANNSSSDSSSNNTAATAQGKNMQTTAPSNGAQRVCHPPPTPASQPNGSVPTADDSNTTDDDDEEQPETGSAPGRPEMARGSSPEELRGGAKRQDSKASQGGTRADKMADKMGAGCGIARMLIIDARSYPAALANRAKGGGLECIEYYPNCDIKFMSLGNIHVIRKSFHALRNLYSSGGGDQNMWLQGLDATRWLQHLSLLIYSAQLVVTEIDQHATPVMIHCSDGWDRTPQICALAQVILDPYYRTFEGFRVLVEREGLEFGHKRCCRGALWPSGVRRWVSKQGFRVLVEREWLEFGHKFADRCGLARCCEDTNERCPVFLQWLDAVHQLLQQFPHAFQFNQSYLVKLAQHTYSNLFGTFLCNTQRERESSQVPQLTGSVWGLLHVSNKQLRNPLYVKDKHQVLEASHLVKDLCLWRAVYMYCVPASALLEESQRAGEEEEGGSATPGSEGGEAQVLSKTRSCDNLNLCAESDDASFASSSARRLSDPSVGLTSAADTQPDSVVAPGNVTSQDGTSHIGTTSEEEDTSSQQNGKGREDKSSKSEKSGSKSRTLGYRTGDQGAKAVNGHTAGPGLDPVVYFERRRGDNMESSSDQCIQFSSLSSSSISQDGKRTMHTPSCSMHTPSCGCEGREGRGTPITPAPTAHVPNGSGGVHLGCHIGCHGSTCVMSTSTGSNVTLTGQEGVLAGGSEGVGEGGEEGAEVGQDAARMLGEDDDHVARVHSSNSKCSLHTVGSTANGHSCDTSATLSCTKCSNNKVHVTKKQNGSGAPGNAGGCCCCGQKCACVKKGVRSLDEYSREVYMNGVCNGISTATVNRIKQVRAADMSTSTSDLSDSHVSAHIFGFMAGIHRANALREDGARSLEISTNTELGRKGGRLLQLDVSACGGKSGVRREASKDSTHSSASSTPSPSLEKSYSASASGSPWPASRSVARYLDAADGLRTAVDEQTSHVLQLHEVYGQRLSQQQRVINTLLYHLQRAQQAGGCRPTIEDWTCDSEDSDPGSLGNHSNAASDVSWEHLATTDADMTLWVPDHVVTHCAGCEGQFWVARRKHHCRSCGKVFCGECSRFFAPVPKEQLKEPARVCRNCYMRLAGPAGVSASNGARDSAVAMESKMADPQFELESAMNEPAYMSTLMAKCN